MSASAPTIPPIRTREEVVVGRRATALLLVLLVAALTGAGTLLAHEIRQRHQDALQTHLHSALQMAVGEMSQEALQVQQEAAGLAALPSLQQALVSGDRAALTRLTSPVPGASAAPGSAAPAESALALQRDVQVISGGRVVGTVTMRIPLDGALLARLRAVVPLRAGEGLLLVHGSRIVAAAPRLMNDRIPRDATSVQLHGERFAVAQNRLLAGSAAVRVVALAPQSEVDAAVSRADRFLALALAATLATLTLLARLLAGPILLPLQRLARDAEGSVTDQLTELPNRRAFESAAARELGRARRSGLPLGVAMIDVDNFKRVNDTYGHDAGDAVLRIVAEELRHQFRGMDFPCRYGGEEFAVLLPDTTRAGAQEAAERFRISLAERVVGDGQRLPPSVTASIGVAVGVDRTAGELLRAADEALYRAKRDGKNRVLSTEA